MKKMNKILSLLMVLCLTVGMLAGCGAKDADKSPAAESSGSETAAASGDVIYDGEGIVYFAIPDSSISRWPKFDAPMIEKWLNIYAPNMEFKVLDAEGDAQKQLQQIEGAITSGCDFLVYTPAEELSAAGALQALNDEEIPFCALAHTPYGGKCEMMVTMPFPSIAQRYITYMEESVLPNAGEMLRVACIWGVAGSPFNEQLKDTWHAAFEAWEAEGKIEVVFEADTNDWTAASSTPVTEQMLTQAGNDVDVVISVNDDLLTGIVSALEEQNMIDDVILLGGCDSTIEGLARVQEGWQAADVLPDYETQAKAVAEVAAKWLRDGKCPADMAEGMFDNNSEEGLPQIYIDPLLITADNIKAEIIDKGVATQEAIDEVAKTLK